LTRAARRRWQYVGYSDFLEEVRNNHIKSAVIQEGQGGTEILAVTTDDRKDSHHRDLSRSGPGG
jgi:hypothetical protein